MVKAERTVKTEGAPAPTGYRDIPLYSADTRSVTTHLMKFAHHNRVDPNNTEQFIPPVKLNRKMPLRVKQAPAQPGDVVVDKWGKPVLTGEGKPLRWPGPDDDLEALRPYLELDKKDENDMAPGSGHLPRGRLFKKRVREVHKSANAARRTRNEEFFPWVLEDFETSNDWESSRNPAANSIQALEAYYIMETERRARAAAAGVDAHPVNAEVKAEAGPVAPAHAPWVGQLEGESDENSMSHHVLFVFDERNTGGFKVVPIRRQYKFMQSQRPVLDSDASAPALRELLGAARARASRGSRAAPRAVRPPARRGASPRWPCRKARRWVEQQPAARRCAREDRERGGEDDAFVVPKQDTTYDELDFEESFADDEERPDTVLEEDQEAKELEERLKREMVADHVDDEVTIKRDPDEVDDAMMINRRSGADDVLGGTVHGRHDDAQLTGTGRQMRKIMKALSRREGNDVYDSDEDAKNPYASDESDDEQDLDVLHPERAILEAREERARQERLAREAQAPPPAPETPRAATPDDSLKRKSEVRRDDTPKRAKLGEKARGSSPARTLSPLEAELAQLVRDGTVRSTAELVQHFRQRLKADASLKEQLSAAVKKIAYMDKKSNRLKLKEGF
ncbi:TFG1 [Malassezia furfur]|nr:TFG1 [Malassezia furfur]